MTMDSRSTSTGVPWGRKLGLAPGWLLLLVYLAWLIHNALPWLAGTPLPAQAPAVIARLIALPPALAVPGVSLSPLVAVLALALFVVLLALTLNRVAAPSQPASLAEPAPVGPPTPPSTPAPAPQAEEASESAMPAQIRPVKAFHQRQTTTPLSVFICSSGPDLVKYRERLHHFLMAAKDLPIAMEDWGASPDNPATNSLKKVSEADVVVLIVAWRYGDFPKGETRSITEMEFEKAQQLGIPVYAYLADSSTKADDGPNALFPASVRNPKHAKQLGDFRARFTDDHLLTYDTFTTPDELSAKVLAMLRSNYGASTAGHHPLVLARNLDRTKFSMGDDDAANLRYLTAPVQDAWKTATTALANARDGIGGKRGVIVLGEASSGKTRLALEAIIAELPDWPTLRWYESSSLEALRAAGALPDNGLILFIDNLDRFPPAIRREAGSAVIALASNPAATLRELVESIGGPLIIVATCRTEGEGAVRGEMTWLFDKLAPVTIPQFDANPDSAEAQGVIAAFAAEGIAYAEDYDGTIGSLTLGLSAKRGQYHDLVERGLPAADVLRAMKLLYLAGIYRHSELRVRAVCGQIFHHLALAEDARVWDDACGDLLNPQFVEITDDAVDDKIALVIRKDTYFEKVIDDYPNPRDPGQGDRHLAALAKVFATLGDLDGQFELFIYPFWLGDSTTRLAAYERALALDPHHAVALVNKGAILQAQGKTKEALAACERALALNPQLAPAWYNKGAMLKAQGKTEEALAAYERALILKPTLDFAWNAKGAALFDLKRYEEALAAYGRALALNPADAGALINKRVALHKLGRYDEALAMYDEALAKSPDDTQTWNGRGYVLLAMGRHDEAVASIDRALALEPEDADWWDSRGEILLKAGRYQEAIAAYDEALKRRPNLASSREGKARALRTLGRDAEADALDLPDAPAPQP